MSNRLVNETSPYLQQHAHNPVDWYPWTEEALRKAKAEDKPIFLSIGYSACHWCHVMKRESFEDEKIANILNEHFVSIKVDREERPDIDHIYMKAVQALTGSGGWPMSVFLTPEGKPFYGGTYFPPEPRYGMPSFKQVLGSVRNAWENRRQKLVESSEQLTASIKRQTHIPGRSKAQEIQDDTLKPAFQNLSRSFDETHGGWGSAPKFPQPMILEFLLRHHHTTGEPEALRMASQTLEAMARGGIYDQLGGGFHRYSVDARWLAPHFEKMLYDSAQLARVYLHAWQLTGKPLFRAVAEETLDYIVREMTDSNGGFYSTQDAESDGEEGKFFLWKPDEIQAILGDQAVPFMKLYNVTERGNFEGKNILTFTGSHEEREAMGESRRRLLVSRDQRNRPQRDEKILTSWNGLALAAFAEAARTLNRQDYGEIAERNADFLLRELRTQEGRLWHTWKDGKPKVNGYLEDYAYLIDGLLELYQTTFAPRWYQAAQELNAVMLDHFSTPSGGFFDTSDDHEDLIARPRALQDNAVPSGNSMATFNLLRLTGLAVEPRYAEIARGNLSQIQNLLRRHPSGFGQWLIALDYALAKTKEIAIIGDPNATNTQEMLANCTGEYHPHQMLAAGKPDEDHIVPLLQDRAPIKGKPTAYVCIDFTCKAPVTTPQDLSDLL